LSDADYDDLLFKVVRDAPKERDGFLTEQYLDEMGIPQTQEEAQRASNPKKKKLNELAATRQRASVLTGVTYQTWADIKKILVLQRKAEQKQREIESELRQVEKERETEEKKKTPRQSKSESAKSNCVWALHLPRPPDPTTPCMTMSNVFSTECGWESGENWAWMTSGISAATVINGFAHCAPALRR